MNSDNIEYIYVLGDGDNIRSNIEYRLLNRNLEALTIFSQNLIIAINQIKEAAISTMSARIIMAGGDDIFFCVPRGKYKREFVQQLQEAFYNTTGVTISFGVGKTIEIVYINLRRAKVARDTKIVEEEML
jgi:hypothetical protein